MAEGYNDQVLDHFNNPRNVGVIEDADADGSAFNPVCGDRMRITLKIQDDRVAAAKFQTQGCPAAIATSSLTTELVAGMTLDQVAKLTKEQIAEAIGGLPSSKLHCSVLAEDALREALSGYRQRSER